MDLTLTMETRPELLGVARSLAARFAESAGCPGPAVERFSGGVGMLVTRAAAEHPGSPCEVVVRLVAGERRVEVTVSYPSGKRGPKAAAGAGGEVPADLRELADQIDCRTEDGVHRCRMVCQIADGSR